MKKFLALILLILSTVTLGQSGVVIGTLLDGVSATATGNSRELHADKRTYQAFGSLETGTGSATIKVQVSNDNSNWITVDTLSLSLTTTSTSDYYQSEYPWGYTRGVLSAVSGSTPSITLQYAERSRF